MKTGIDIIAEERQRQIDVEGWTPEHDDAQGENLALAAGCYAMPDHYRDMYDDRVPYIPYYWPDDWDDSSWKPTPDDRVRELAKAGALIAAEIDRLNREKFKHLQRPE